ncbi:putative ribonuclease H-like domain-containing protein [Tanacetum coccineum]|uniref:Ribonuclease H-like domain-containing protein n=1 Tax=Tanacetum coccineum TaxID=301880 RepID=A0ABQ4ZE21_9ASTR
MKHSYSNDDTCFSIDVIDEILEEDFDALLDEGSKIFHSIEGTLLEEEIFVELDEFMAMIADENSDSESETKDPPFEKITISTDYKIKTSLEEPPTDLELKPLPDNLEYVFLEEPSFLPVIISSQLTKENKNKLIQLLDDKKPVVQKQIRLNPSMQEVIKKEIMKLLDTGVIYPIANSPWVSPIQCVSKKGGITVVTNENDELGQQETIRVEREKGVIDNGYSRHMTGNMSYLTNFEEIKGGYVAFGGNPKGRKITGIGNGPNWLFDIDALTKSMNYKLVIVGNQSNGNAGTKAYDDIGDDKKKVTKEPRKEGGDLINAIGKKTRIELLDDLNMPELEEIVYSDDDEDVDAEADMNNLDTVMPVSLIPTIREELLQFKLQEVVELPNGKRAIGTKWVFRNKKNERGIVIKNKTRLVAQGLCGVPNGCQEEVYVCQPPEFEDPDFPSRVYKVEKTLYGLYQALKAWYETLSTYLLDNKFQRGKIDKTLFIRRDKGELTFFLGLQVKQKEDGIFISQDNYVIEILKKFGFSDVKIASTPMKTQKALLKDEDGKEVDVHLYRLMIGSLMYITSSRLDIMFVVCACARYQVNLKVSHLHAVKRIFSDYAGASLDRKSTIGGCQFLKCRLISW